MLRAAGLFVLALAAQFRCADCEALLTGRAAERGTHWELVAADWLYGRLWRLQTGEVPASRPGTKARLQAVPTGS
ncbi:MAG TPA: hypothetical protein VMM17_12075 [Gemmatimonadaceae bacterium]|nr:hypothetical protein [Gemmatimonadaceae bacterium]